MTQVPDLDAILRAAGIGQANIEAAREWRERQTLARQVIDEGARRLLARLGPNSVDEPRVRRVLDVLHRAVKRMRSTS